MVLSSACKDIGASHIAKDLTLNRSYHLTFIMLPVSENNYQGNLLTLTKGEKGALRMV